MVAPYEADAQLAFLNKADIAQAIITEDSDLLAFGCKKVLHQGLVWGSDVMTEEKQYTELTVRVY